MSLPPELHHAVQRELRRQPAAALCVGVTHRGTHALQVLRGEGAAPPETSIYALGTLTQVFTGALLALMVERGELRLDTPLSDVIPRGLLPDEAAGRITLVQLATHTAGLPSLPPNLGRPANPEDPLAGYTALHFGEFLRNLRPTKPGPHRYAESLLGMGLLGHALGRRAGLNYAHALRDLLVRPLGLTDTAARVDDAQQGRLLPGHRGGHAVPAWSFPALPGAGALYSTGSDLLRFLDANLGAAHLGQGESLLVRALQRTHAPQARVGSRGVGLGWLVEEAAQGPLLWRASALGGYAGFLGLAPTAGVGLVLLSDHARPRLSALLRRQPLEARGLALLRRLTTPA
jgi:CubicO group peptidase (beta-lactamase class C family)